MAPRCSTDMPAELAATAFRLFAKQGIRNVSVDAIAAAAGVTKGSLYWHYASKDELIHAACTHYYRMYHERLAEELARAERRGELLERAIGFGVKSCLFDPENRAFTLEILALAVHDAAVRRSWLQFYTEVREEYTRLLQQAGNPAPETVADTLLEAFEGVKLRALFEPQVCTDPAHERRITAHLLDVAGCAAKKAAAGRRLNPAGRLATSLSRVTP